MFKFSFFVAVLSLLGAQQLWAQEFRLGYVNLDRIIREAAPSKSAQAKLEQEFARREKDLQEIGNALKSAADKLEREAMTLSESQRAARQKQVM
jgi:outer membrane protein